MLNYIWQVEPLMGVPHQWGPKDRLLSAPSMRWSAACASIGPNAWLGATMICECAKALSG